MSRWRGSGPGYPVYGWLIGMAAWADAGAEGSWATDEGEGSRISMRVALSLGGFRVVGEEMWERCHGDGHALNGRKMRADYPVRMRIHSRP